MAQKGTPPAAIMTASRRERRGQIRIPADVRVLFRSLTGTVELRTDNVNRGGLFLKTLTPVPLRELIQIAVDVGDGPLLETLAMVRHVTTMAASRQSGLPVGMGVQLYGLSASDRQRWEGFVQRQAKERQLEGWDEGPLDDEIDYHADGNATPLPPLPDLPPLMGPAPQTANTRGAALPAPNASARSREARGKAPEPTPQDSPRVVTRAVTPHTAITVNNLDVRPPPPELDDPPSQSGTRSRSSVGTETPTKRVRAPGPPEYRVKLSDAVLLRRLLEQASGRGFLLTTQRLIEEGTRMRLVVVHGVSGQQSPLDCEVLAVRAPALGHSGALLIRLVNFTDQKRAAYEAFIENAATDYDLELSDALVDDDK